MTDGTTWSVGRNGTPLPKSGAKAAVRSAMSVGPCEVSLVRGSEQSLRLVTNGYRAMLIVWGREGFDDGVQASDPGAGPGRQQGYELLNGQSDEYADVDTVPLDAAIAAVEYIVEHLTLDPRVRWRRW